MMKHNDEKLDRHTCITHCIVAKFSESEALAYLKSKGHNIQKTVYYHEKKKIKENRINFATQLSDGGFLDQHVQRIESLEIIEKEFWLNYHIEDDPLKKCMILSKIQNIQPFISSAYDYTKLIIEEQSRLKNTIPKIPNSNT